PASAPVRSPVPVPVPARVARALAVPARTPRQACSREAAGWAGAAASGPGRGARAGASPRPRSPTESWRRPFGSAEVQRQRELDEDDVRLEALVDDELVAEVEPERDALAGEDARAETEVDRGAEHGLTGAARDVGGDAFVHHGAPERAEHLEVAHARVEPRGLAVDRRPHHVGADDPVQLREGSGAHSELRLELIPEAGLDVVREEAASHLPGERITEVVDVA